MSSVANSQSGFWSRHFTNLAAESTKSGNKQLDFSNAAVAVQTYAFIIEACGQLDGKHVLDCGFGTGELARMLDLLGGSVDAIDLVSTRIPQLRHEAPSVFWSAADIATWTLPKNSDPYDVIVACEVLQYVDFDAVIANLLESLTDQGRLVIMLPNADCPIVKRSSSRFDKLYTGVSPYSLRKRFADYASAYRIYYRGIRFQDDQSLVPYISDPWVRLCFSDARADATSSNDSSAISPNRLQIAFSR